MKQFFLSVILSFLVMQLNAQRTFQKIYWGSQPMRLDACVKNNDGSILISGTSSQEYRPDSIICVLKLDNSGQIKGNFFSNGKHSKVWSFEDIDSNFTNIVFYDYDKVDKGVSLLKTSPAGNILFARRYKINNNILCITGVIKDKKSDIIITGWLKDGFDKKSVSYILKLNGETGEPIWFKSYKFIPTKLFEAKLTEFWGICDARIDGYAIAGSLRVNDVNNYYVAMLIDTSGKQKWSNIAEVNEGGLPYTFNYNFSINPTTDSGFIAAGHGRDFETYGSSDCSLIKYSKTGQIDWANQTGGPYTDEAHYVTQTVDGGYLSAGYSESDFLGFKRLGYLIKYNSDGNRIWVYKDTLLKYGATLMYQYAYEQSDRSIAVLGSYSPDGGSRNYISLTKINPDGKGCGMPANNDFQSKELILKNVTNNYKLKIDNLMPLLQISNDKSFKKVENPINQEWLCFKGAPENNKNIQASKITRLVNLQITPNPVEGSMLSLNAMNINPGPLTINICDGSGKVLLSKSFVIQSENLSEKINISQLPAGIYNLQFYNDQKFENLKFIKL